MGGSDAETRRECSHLLAAVLINYSLIKQLIIANWQGTEMETPTETDKGLTC